MHRLDVIDSHTEGEPTRVVVAGGPELPAGPAAANLEILRDRFDWLRSTVCNEPRGFDALVGALLLPPSKTEAEAQVVFFNNVGYLGMCVHGTIGVAETLRHLGRAVPGSQYLLETPVGDVTVELRDDRSVAVENVESYRHATAVAVETERLGIVVGDVAWGGNWFFLVEEHGQELSTARLDALTDYTVELRQALSRQGITGASGAEIDHIELFGPPTRGDADSRNFVLCPGRAYDRSPCGTGTSAKMACLAADGKLEDGQVWRQESILGTRFCGTVQRSRKGVIPTVVGRAWVTSEAQLVLTDDDPFREGIRS